MLIAQTLETPRLVLRPEELSDAEGLHQMQTDPEVMRFIGDGGIINWSIEDYRRAIARSSPTDHGNLTIVCQMDRRYLGWCGLTPEVHTGEIQLGYRLLRQEWGQGYATDAAGAVWAFGRERLKLKRIVATVHPANTASRRVLEKVGMRQVGEIDHKQAKCRVCLYAIEQGTLDLEENLTK